MDVAKVFALGASVGLALALSAVYIGKIITMSIVAIVSISYLAKACYDIRVTQLKYEQERIERALKQ